MGAYVGTCVYCATRFMDPGKLQEHLRRLHPLGWSPHDHASTSEEDLQAQASDLQEMLGELRR